jgi:hypothetical protein
MMVLTWVSLTYGTHVRRRMTLTHDGATCRHLRIKGAPQKTVLFVFVDRSEFGSTKKKKKKKKKKKIPARAAN